MTLLIIGMAIFIGIHLLPTFAAVRQLLVARLGTTTYKGLFSLLSLAGLVLIVIGKGQAPFVPLWAPPDWSRHAALTVMPIALMLLVAAYLPSNIKRFIRHPMLWGVTLWAAVHLLANGDLASVILFGGIGAFALFDMWSANQRGAQPSSQPYPFTRDLLVAAVGFAAYGIFLVAHPYLFGVPVLR